MMLSENRSKINLYGSHLLVWVLFIIYESLITIVVTGKFWTPLDYFNSYFINIVLFYFNAYVLLPYSHKKPFYITVSLILLTLICSTGVKYLLSEWMVYSGINTVNPFENLYTGISFTVWRFIYFTGLSTGYWFALNTIAERKKVSDLEKNKLLAQLQKEQLEKKLADSEIAYRKAQINPHFLFNTLSFLYNSSLKTAQEMSKPILLLSDIMRYALTETPVSGKVDLEDEIEHINSFIELNQSRFDNKLQLSFHVNGETSGRTILPLVLLTPIENIFKYGDLKNNSHPATIDLEIRGDHLRLTSNNKKLKSRRNIVSHGVGLKNLKLRLDAYYSDAHEIQVSENEEDYIFELQITL